MAQEPQVPSIYQLLGMPGPKCPDCLEIQENECEATGREVGAQYNPVIFRAGDWGEFVQPQLNVFAAPCTFMQYD